MPKCEELPDEIEKKGSYSISYFIAEYVKHDNHKFSVSTLTKKTFLKTWKAQLSCYRLGAVVHTTYQEIQCVVAVLKYKWSAGVLQLK